MKTIVLILFLTTTWNFFSQDSVILQYNNGYTLKYSDLYGKFKETLDYQIVFHRKYVMIVHWDNKNYAIDVVGQSEKLKEVYSNRTLIKLKLIPTTPIKFILTEIKD